MVTILDFGQAVPISNEDRVGGLDLLTVIGKADWPWLAARRLNRRYFDGRKSSRRRCSSRSSSGKTAWTASSTCSLCCPATGQRKG